MFHHTCSQTKKQKIKAFKLYIIVLGSIRSVPRSASVFTEAPWTQILAPGWQELVGKNIVAAMMLLSSSYFVLVETCSSSFSLGDFEQLHGAPFIQCHGVQLWGHVLHKVHVLGEAPLLATIPHLFSYLCSSVSLITMHVDVMQIRALVVSTRCVHYTF